MYVTLKNELLDLRIVECLRFAEFSNFENETLEFGNVETLKIRRRALGNDEDPPKHLQTLGYEFHIDQKHEMEIW